jgi:hypothetical protein
MLLAGYQKIRCVFATGLFTVDYCNVIEGTGFYKGATMVMRLSLLSMTSGILLCLKVCLSSNWFPFIVYLEIENFSNVSMWCPFWL